ncbi:MAG: glycoside hydrolase family 97 protein [Amphiplicatus sp.]
MAVMAAGLAAAFAGFGAASAEEARLSSPDGEIVVTVTDEGGLARYVVAYRGETVIAPSRLGLLFKNRHGFDDGLAIASVERAAKDETWEQPWGERRFVRDRHNEMLVEFISTTGPARRFFARFRAFDDGVGFRYEVPEQKRLGKVEIVEELTEFATPAGSTAWWIPARYWNRYEYLYETTPVEEVLAAHTPITLRAPSGVHLSIHEAALVDYSGMALKQARPGTFRADLAPWSDGVLVKTETPFVSPWRTIQIAPDAVGLLNSDLILNLNEPNKLGDVSWVEPGKYVGVWWAMHIRERTWGRDGVHGATTEETKRYIDFAAKYGFKGVLVEGWNVGWDGDWYNNGDVFSFTEAYPDFDIEDVAAYAREKGVRLIGHHETSGSVTNYENQLADAFDLYERLGVRQVKTGYVADAGRIKRVDEKGIARYEYHDGQFMANHHLRVLEEAAKRRISINAHEPIKDTGLRRTYPNWIAREGARGQEYNAWGLPPNPPEHAAILPYTRMLSGPMDFTPGIFDLEPNRRPPVREDMPRHDPASRVQTTLAKQLALYVVLYSPIQMAADLPENYEKRPDAFQFILDVPTDWEESAALAGEVGDYVVFARKERGGEDWFVGALTDEEARDLKVPLDFLDEGRAYVAQVYRDGPDAHWETNPYAMVIEERRVTRADALALPLAPGGGAAVRLRPAGR